MKLKVLFVCVENAGRSQMAEAFARAAGAGIVEAWSAGSKPAAKVNDMAVAAMKEKGHDLAGKRPKGLAEVPSEGWDYVVTMGCGDACPFVPSRAKIDWAIPDPKGKPLEDVRPIRDLIESRVVELLREALKG